MCRSVRANPAGQEVSLLSALSDGKKPVNNFTSQSFQPFYLLWSPNSQTIAFLGSDAVTGALSQYLVAAAGGKSKLIGGGQPYYWDWSPDARTMIVHTGGASSENPDARLAFVGVDGSTSNKDLDVKPGLFRCPGLVAEPEMGSPWLLKTLRATVSWSWQARMEK